MPSSTACTPFRPTFAPMRARRLQIEAQPGYVKEVPAKGDEVARQTAREVLGRVKEAVGLR